jgi:4-diphosphocytidyl-2-C-methyl-D-erythritol kinase
MVAETSIVDAALAKINLYLHVTGKRADGYHLLDSLVVLADIGDQITATPSDILSLNYTGPFANGLPPAKSNLVLHAAERLKDAFSVSTGAALTLNKALPVASGIGGGSADAAATLRALCKLWHLDITHPKVADLALLLGADVPVCLRGQSAIMRGIGEDIRPVDHLPPLSLILINPGVEVSTPAVFKARTSAFSNLVEIPGTFNDASAFHAFLKTTQNDLEPPAMGLQPIIGDVLEALRALPGVVLARMSGSGATCFGIVDNVDAARTGAHSLSASHPRWWVQATSVK